MSDKIVTTSTQGYGSRLMESIKMVVVGLLLFVVSFPLLWWNEGRAVQTYQSLEEGAKAVVSVSNDKVDPANEGKLVHVSGKAITDATLTDPMFGVSANALKLSRTAEMYQWIEDKQTKTTKNAGGSETTETTYEYRRDWREGLVDSSSFYEEEGHENPRAMRVESAGWRADKVTLGAFTLTDDLVDDIDAREDIAVTEEMLAGGGAVAAVEASAPEAAPQAAKGKKGGKAKKAPPKKVAKGKSKSGTAQPKVVAGDLYLGADPEAPVIGDVRVSFSKMPPAEVSVLAQQTGSSFSPYQTKAGDALSILQSGVKSADAMFAQAQSENAMLTWILRLVGFVLMAMGLGMIFRPLAVVADVLPLLGDMLRMGIGVLAFGLAAPLSLLTIALAWLFYRPLLGVVLLGTGIAAFVLIKMLAMKRRAAAAPAAPAAAS